MFKLEIEFDMSEDVLVNCRMKVCDGESKFDKGRFHKILEIINRVARSNSYNRSGKGLHDYSKCLKVKKVKEIQFFKKGQSNKQSSGIEEKQANEEHEQVLPSRTSLHRVPVCALPRVALK